MLVLYPPRAATSEAGGLLGNLLLRHVSKLRNKVNNARLGFVPRVFVQSTRFPEDAMAQLDKLGPGERPGFRGASGLQKGFQLLRTLATW